MNPETGFPGTFTYAQTKQLLAPIRPQRVLSDGKGHSHVSQQDVTAHLIRVFGFGNFLTEIVSLDLVHETVRPLSQQGTMPGSGSEAGKNMIDLPHRWRYDCAYRAAMRLTIFDRNHNPVAHYEDASIGDATNQTRADAHDLAMKSAISLAKKRCAINLGDQFGLSLYNKGQMEALVGGTHVLPVEPRDHAGASAKDLQEDVPKQESLGVDEIEKEAQTTEEQEQMLAASLGATTIDEQGPNPDHTKD